MDALRKQKFNQAMFSKNRTLAIRVGKYQSSDIKEASFDYGYIKGDAYKPGGTCAGSAKIVFTSIITTFNKLDKVYPEVGLLVDGTYEWVKMGEYFINDIEIDRNRNTTKLDLMDGMFKLNREHVTDLSYPAEIRHVIKEICLKTGITLANEYMDITSMNYRIEHIPKDKKMTFRDVLSLASQMLGMSCFFNREGKLEVKELTDSGIVITADSYFMHGLTKSEIEYQIAGITCKKDKEILTVGLRTGRSLEIENLLMSQSALGNLYHNIKDIRYYPFNLNYQGHLLLDVGQWVTIKTNTGETFKSPVLSQSFTFKGGLRGRISADSKAGNDAQYSYAGTITKKIEQFNEIEAQIQSQLEEADKGFDQKVEKIKNDFSDQVELAKTKAEETKQEIINHTDQIIGQFSESISNSIQTLTDNALEKAKEAKRISLDSVAKLEEFKRQATSAQTALSGDLDVLKRTVNNEVSQTSEYRRTTTEALSRMTGQMNGFATKSEVAQGIDGLTQTFAKMKVGGRNLLRGSKGPFLPDRKPANFDNNILYVGNTSIYMEQGQEYTISAKTDGNFTAHHDGNKESDNVVLWIMDKDVRNYQIVSDLKTDTTGTKIIWNKPTGIYHLRVNTYHKEATKSVWDVKIEKGNVATDWSPAIEDIDGLITEAKAIFERTAQGLRTDLSAIQEYVNKDSQRQDVLQRYTREESAKQATVVRELVARDYVGKATHQEDVRGIERRLEAITNPQNGSIATQIANYKTAVDGRFADISSLLSGKANQADFQRVKETSQLYERILGNTENGIADKVARMALTNQLFQIEVSKNEGLKTVQRQIAGSWSVQNINSAGDLISGVNLGADGINRFIGKLTHITGETLIDKAVIKSAMVDKLKTANFEAGSVTTVVLDAEAVTAEKLKVDQAFFNKLVANEAYLNQLFAKQAFINRVQSISINASQVKAGFLSGDRILGGTITGSNIYGGTLTGRTQILLGSYGSFDTVNGGLQINVPREPDTKDGLGVQFIGSYGRGENVPYGLFIYKDSDFTVGGTAETSDDFLLTVEGYIQTKGIGWLKTGKGSINGKTTGTVGFWNSDNVSLSFGGSNNDIYYSYNGTAYSLWALVDKHFSDRRLKENIVVCEHNALDYIREFQFKEYDWKKQEDRPQKAHTKIGLIAQEVQAVDPTLVYENGDTLNLDNLRLTNIALKAIQELSQRIETLERKLA